MTEEGELHNVHELPPDMPVPVDDGACNHLQGLSMPSVVLPSTWRRPVSVAEVSLGNAVFFFYPATGRPGIPAPKGWNEIPGARGCTPQNCAFRDHFSDFRQLGFQVFGVSAQHPEDQLEFAARNHIPYEVLSDYELRLARALRLPTFEVKPPTRLHPPVCIKRLTLVVTSSVIRKVFYPIFPPDKNAEEVLKYLNENRKMLWL